MGVSLDIGEKTNENYNDKKANRSIQEGNS